MLRTPSPGPPLSLDLSTIMEADSSGISKHVPILSTNSSAADSRSPSPTIINPTLLYASSTAAPTSSSSQYKESVNGYSGTTTPDTRSSECDADTSALELCTTHIASQVIDAMRASDRTADAQEWLNADQAIIIDGDDHPEVADASFSMDINLESVDPALAALLSPNSATTSKTIMPSPQSSPTTPKSPFRAQRNRQSSSFLPRPRPLHTPSPTTSVFPTTPLSAAIPSSSSATTTPNESPAKGIGNAVNGNGRAPGSPPSSPSSPISRSSAPTSSTPVASRRTMAFTHSSKSFTPMSTSSISASTAARVFGADKTASGINTTPSGIGKGRPGARTLRQVMLGSASKKTGSEAMVSSAPPLISLSSPPSPSHVATVLGRGSLDSRRAPAPREARPSLDVHRPPLETSSPRGSFEMRRNVSGSLPSKRPGLAGGNLYIPRSSTSPERDRGDFGTGGESSSPSPPAGGDDATSYYRPSLDSSRPSLDSTARPGSAARLRTPSLRMERSQSENTTVHGNTSNSRLSPIPPPGRMRKRSMSVQERLGRGSRFTADRERDKAVGEFGESRPSSSLSMGRNATSRLGGGDGPKPEWLGPRTAKAFRAAGLLDFEREREEGGGDPSSTERAFTTRDRSGSATTVPSPLGNGGTVSGGRFGSLRGTSEFEGNNGNNNTGSAFGRSHSRMALSEAGGGGSAGRRGSGTFSPYGAGAGLMESPTFTVSSGSRERDTPRSTTSTAPTSISGSFGYLGRDRGERDRDRDREKEEIRELKDKHQVETGALLGALSDSQRTVRVLREENSDLRERLERLGDVDVENDGLRRACCDLRRECTDLRRECVELRREMRLGATRSPSGLGNSWSNASSSGYRTPVPNRLQQGHSGRLQAQWNRDREDQDRLLTVPQDDQHPPIMDFDEEVIGVEDDGDDEEPPLANSTSTLPTQRRLSTTSSIFPVLPPNMTMLLHEDSTNPADLSGSNRSSLEQSNFRFPSSHMQSQPQSIPSRGKDGGGHTVNISISSAASISPATANFSMVTGSPGSLFLRPEHEVLLGEMESLDLGVRGDGELELELDAW